MQNLTAKAATSLYKTLKAHGLQGRALWDVTQAALVAQTTICYSLLERVYQS